MTGSAFLIAPRFTPAERSRLRGLRPRCLITKSARAAISNQKSCREQRRCRAGKGAALHPEHWDFMPWKSGFELKSCSWHRSRMQAAQPGMLLGGLGCAQAPERFWGVPKPRRGEEGWGFCPVSHPVPTHLSDVGTWRLGPEETDSPSHEML